MAGGKSIGKDILFYIIVPDVIAEQEKPLEESHSEDEEEDPDEEFCDEKTKLN